MNLDAAVQSYLVESMEMLDQMEQSLLGLEAGTADEDAIHAVFRAAHTIKGTGGIFGFDAIVEFTHQVESVLDKVRAGGIAVDDDLVALMLRCCDHIRTLLEPVTRGETLAPEIINHGEVLQAELSIYLGGESSKAPATSTAVTVVEDRVASIDAGHQASADHWHISLRFGPEVLRNGMDPISFLRYLGSLGDLLNVLTLTDALPEAADLDPEACYLGFEISLQSKADREQIESAFDFVRDDCAIRILPPRSKVSEYIELIDSLPEDTLRLGEMLVATKALTAAELERGLIMQEQSRDRDGASVQAPLGEILVREESVDPSVVAAALDKQQAVRERKAQENRVIRVDADKLEILVNLIGELVIASANVQLSARAAGATEVTESVANLSRLVNEVRDSALSLQMVPIGQTFQKFQRVVRDVSKELGKDVELVINGGDTELDKSVVERISDPLMHLVRNSLDHGIEPVDERLAANKSPRAKVMLNAYHDSGSIVIEVSDDGRGLNREKILAKAVSRGLVNAGQSLSDSDVYGLIFEPGFSTADQVSNLSGRGVGMDVVKRNVEASRGTVQVESEPGRGATMRIRLPLTLAIIDGFLVGLGRARYIIPMDMLVECLEHAGSERATAEKQGYLNIRGEVLPVIRLDNLFGIQREPVRRENLVIVRYGSLRAGIVVDELLGEFQTVIKPLGPLFEQLSGISGSTILGSGEVALILDIPGLLSKVAATTNRSVTA